MASARDINQSARGFDGNDRDIFNLMRIVKEVVVDTSSDEVFFSVSRWLAECEGKHPLCRMPGPNFMPSRLVDVGAFDGSRELLLVELKGQAFKYATLSYCWGEAEG